MSVVVAPIEEDQLEFGPGTLHLYKITDANRAAVEGWLIDPEGACNLTMPLDQSATVAEVAAAHVFGGATESGSEVSIESSNEEVMVAERRVAIDQVNVSVKGTVTASLAEDTAKSLMLSLGTFDAVENSEGNKIIVPSSETKLQNWGYAWESDSGMTRVTGQRMIASGNAKYAYKAFKGSDYRTIPLELTSIIQPPFRFIFPDEKKGDGYDKLAS